MNEANREEPSLLPDAAMTRPATLVGAVAAVLLGLGRAVDGMGRNVAA